MRKIISLAAILLVTAAGATAQTTSDPFAEMINNQRLANDARSVRNYRLQAQITSLEKEAHTGNHPAALRNPQPGSVSYTLQKNFEKLDRDSQKRRAQGHRALGCYEAAGCYQEH